MDQETTLHLKEYLRIINKRHSVVLVFFAVIFFLVALVTFSATPVYIANTKVLIEKVRPAGIGGTDFYGYSGADPAFYETQNQLIKSYAVGRKVVEILALDKTYDTYFSDNKGFSPTRWFKGIFSYFFKPAALKSAEAKQVDDAARADKLAKMISAGINVTAQKNSRIVNVSYSSTNPTLAAAVANTVAKAYIEEVLELSMSSTRYTLEWMTRKAEEERQKIDKTGADLQAYSKAHNLVTLENRLAIVPQKMAEINGQLIRAETKRKEAETLLNKVNAVSKNPNEADTLAVISSDAAVNSIRQDILKAEQTITELSQKYGQKHPAMQKAVETLTTLKANREQAIRRVIESVKNDYDLARANELSLQRMLAEAKSEAVNTGETYMEYEGLKREADMNRQVYDSLIKRIKEQDISERSQPVNILVVERAETPKSPAKPKKLLNMLVGILFGIFGGIGMALFVEYLDHTVKSPEDAEIKLGYPVFGVVPLVLKHDKPIELTVLNEPTSAFSENYKGIRAAIMLSSAERPPKRILVTSALQSEGKTVTATSIALAIAQAQYSVLIVDADLRKPRAHKIFKIPNAKGLSTYLAGASDMDIIQPTGVPHLSVIPSGPIPPNPSELLGSNRMTELVARLSEIFDIIIFDSPPLLSVADSLSLSKLVDGTLVVANSGRTSYEEVRRSLHSLAGINAHILGLIINRLDLSKSGYYRYSKYYYYTYGSDHANSEKS